MSHPKTKIETFFGTGGVGKTTLATTRALYLAEKGHSVLLMTIDPSKRLKQVLNISDDTSGKVSKVDSFKASFDGLLLDPLSTFLGLQEERNQGGKAQEIKNKILQILLRPYGGLHDIFSLVELSRQFNKGTYDYIVLDTPPGDHLLDFLESGRKINKFFNKKFMEVFTQINQKSSSIFELAIKTGINKLLSYLEKVTGKSFVEDFIEAVNKVYQLREDFTLAAQIPNDLKNNPNHHWYLVTSLNQKKIKQAGDLKEKTKNYTGEHLTFILNQSQKELIIPWNPESQKLKEIKSFLLNKEKEILNSFSVQEASNILFPEVISSSPKEHVLELKNIWEKESK